MKNAIIAINGTQQGAATVLGGGQVRIPTGGKIRAGIKVLTKKAAENPTAKDIYERGVAENRPFEDIEYAILQAAPALKNPLVPKNVAWFTVRPSDFSNPAIAAQILEAYGEDRGDGIKRLYRFPVVFPADLWQTVMPHELVAWGANERKFWSEYSPDGKTRYCKCHAPVPLDISQKRVIRLFGGRKTMFRVENDGICDPEACPEFQNRQCNLSGRFIFFIPGIKSIDAFELHTNSFYAMSRAIEQFETLAFLRGGRISGFLDEKRTPFYVTKKLREVPHIDEEGRAVRVAQWIIELEAPIDVTALLQVTDDDAVLRKATEAARILESQPDTQSFEQVSPTIIDIEASDASGNPKQVDASRTRAANESHAKNGSASNCNADAPTVEQVFAAAAEAGVSEPDFAEYAAKRWGSGWKINANGRQRAHDELKRYRNDPRGFRDKVFARLKPAVTGDLS